MIDVNDPKTRERIGIGLLAIILFLSGYLMMRDKSAPLEFKEGEATKAQTTSTEQAVKGEISNPEATKGKVSINKASIEELDTLPGIGEITAQKIINYRKANGGFKSLEELKEVSGIGDAKYSAVKNLITL